MQRHHIGDRSLSLCNMFLDEMAKQARNLITDICTEQCTLSDQVSTTLPFNLLENTITPERGWRLRIRVIVFRVEVDVKNLSFWFLTSNLASNTYHPDS